MSGPVLVTGGAGYVGSACAHALAAAGREVVTLDDLSTGHRAYVRWGPLEVGDVGDAARVREVTQRYGITAAVHLAAKALVGESMSRPALYREWNAGKTRRLLVALRSAGVRAVVFSSSCAVYGVPRSLPVREDAARAPISPYGASKAACEDALRASGVPAAILRYFNAAGALPEQGVGERHEPETHLIPKALRAARTGRPLRVLGTDHPTADGTCVRDYVHVRDLASAHLVALEHLESGGPGGTWNLGSGRGHSVLEVLAAVEAVTGRRVARAPAPRRAGDPPWLVACAERARRDLGWQPLHSDLRTILADAAAFEAGSHVPAHAAQGDG